MKNLWLAIGEDKDCDGSLVFGLVMYADTLEECTAMILEDCGRVMASQVVMLVEGSAISDETFPARKISEALTESDGPVYYVQLSADYIEEEIDRAEPENNGDLWARWNNWA